MSVYKTYTARKGEIPLARLLCLIFGMLLASVHCLAQQKDIPNDSITIKKTLDSITVHVFGQQHAINNQPGAVSYLSDKKMNRYNNVNIVSAMNSIPGVRMEMRSPGSIRLNIRGSTLRSPFGVRNVKIYYNGIPLTDPGGNTYLNQLRFADLGSIEIIKGPAGSMYGAGTGGVLLIKSDLFKNTYPVKDQMRLRAGIGSFGLWSGRLTAQWGNDKSKNQVRYGEVKKEGYRNHTNMEHRIAAYETSIKLSNKESLNAFFHYSDLYYQTPGALTQGQFDKNPRAARPAKGGWPSSEENKAAVHQKAFLLGLKHSYHLTKFLKNTTSLYGTYTDFTNPTVRNYEFRNEPHFGGRTVFQYDHYGETVQSRFWLGAEFQQGYVGQQDFQNESGTPDSLMSGHRIIAFTAFLFAQTEWFFPHGWRVNAGVSLNHRKLDFTKNFPAPSLSFTRNADLNAIPRIALSKKVTSDILVYADWSKGFSPPTVSELLPSTNKLNRTLEAEQGTQYEVGSKGFLFNRRLSFNANVFLFRLTQSISVRRDSSGADYFVNAGGVNKKGLELALHYILFKKKNTFFNEIQIWNSLTVFYFKYRDYVTGSKNYSGNDMPGTAPFTDAAGIDVNTNVGLSAHLNWQHTAQIPLNNANTVYASSYNLLGFKLRYQNVLSKNIGFTIAAGGNNLLNEEYSLGDDINAYGGRYFNVAPAVNFYLDVGIAYNFGE